MRIGIDCLRADPEYAGGLNTYIFGLLDGFAAAGGASHFQLYLTTHNRHRFVRYQTLENFAVFVVDGRGFRLRQMICRAAVVARNSQHYRRAANVLFRPYRDLMDAHSDLIYTPTVSLLSFDSRKPTLLSMHDIQYLHYPEFFSWPQRRSRQITCSLSATHATHFQASSEFIREDMLKHFPKISPEQAIVIPEGVNLEDFSSACGGASLAHHRLPARFLFLPAQLWPHKNHFTVLRALRQIERSHGLQIPLILTGARYLAAPAIFRFLKEQHMDYVRHLGVVPFGELVALYQHAALAIAPGLYESNSLPVLEAAAAGTSVIASRIAPNEELARTLQLNLFDPLDEQSLARIVFELWLDPEKCRAQAAHNRRQVACYTWENTARRYLDWMDRILHRQTCPLPLASAAAPGRVHA